MRLVTSSNNLSVRRDEGAYMVAAIYFTTASASASRALVVDHHPRALDTVQRGIYTWRAGSENAMT